MNVFFKCLGDIATVLQDLVVSVFCCCCCCVGAFWLFSDIQKSHWIIKLMAKGMFGNVN